jgi:hypothetical protein
MSKYTKTPYTNECNAKLPYASNFISFLVSEYIKGDAIIKKRTAA